MRMGKTWNSHTLLATSTLKLAVLPFSATSAWPANRKWAPKHKTFVVPNPPISGGG